MLKICLLNANSAKDYINFTYAYFKDKLLESGSNKSITAFGATINEMPVGLIICEIEDDKRKSKVLSLFVHPQFRSKGIGSELLKNVEKYMAAKKCIGIRFNYFLSNNSSIERLDNFFIKNKWQAPLVQMNTYKTTDDENKVLSAEWIQKFRKSSIFRTIPWMDISNEERDKIKVQIAYPEYLSPFQDEGTVESSISLVLKKNDEIAGWLITHKISETILRYTGIFIKEKY